MAVSTIETIFSPQVIASVPADDSFTNAFTINEPGLYEFESPGRDWYYGTAPGLPLGSMTLVPAGTTASFTIVYGDPAMTRWVRAAPTESTLLALTYTPTSNAAAGGTGFTDNDNTGFGLGAGTSFAAILQHNTAIGYHALFACTIGSSNTAVGVGALRSAPDGSSNTALGHNAAGSVTGGHNNVAIGAQALALGAGVTAANVAIGSDAMSQALSVTQNVAIGRSAGQNLNAASQNVLIGDSCGQHLTSSNDNVAVGYAALTTATTGTRSTVVGSLAGAVILTADDSAFFGYHAGISVTTGALNTLVGSASGTGLTSGASNTLLGARTGQTITTGGGNVAVGDEALRYAAAACNAAIAIGNQAMGANQGIDPSDSIAIGQVAGFRMSGPRNIALGYGTLQGNGANMTGTDNIAIGYQSSIGNNTGNYNIGIGTEALKFSGGSDNVGIGYQVLNGLSTGGKNIGIGTRAGAMVALGNESCICIGYEAGRGADGQQSIAIGTTSGKSGLQNVSIGVTAGANLGDAARGNVSVGYSAGGSITTGNRNVMLGDSAGDEITTGSFNIALGRHAGQGQGNLSNYLFIGSTDAPINNVYLVASAPTNFTIWQGRVRFLDPLQYPMEVTDPGKPNVGNGDFRIWFDTAGLTCNVLARTGSGDYYRGSFPIVLDP